MKLLSYVFFWEFYSFSSYIYEFNPFWVRYRYYFFFTITIIIFPTLLTKKLSHKSNDLQEAEEWVRPESRPLALCRRGYENLASENISALVSFGERCCIWIVLNALNTIIFWLYPDVFCCCLRRQKNHIKYLENTNLDSGESWYLEGCTWLCKGKRKRLFTRANLICSFNTITPPILVPKKSQ